MNTEQNYPDILDIKLIEKCPLVTKEVLKKAKEIASSVTYPDYNKKTVKFESDEYKSVADESSNKIAFSVLDLIGKTPMVRLDRFAKHHGIECELFAKCEFLNPGGSVKDRIALQMIDESEKAGQISKGATLIEATSGNAGIALSLVASIKGYNMIITMPEKMSLEKYNTLKALGAEIVWTPTEAAWNESDSHISLAYQLKHILPDAHVLDQYQHPGNSRAHYLYTAEEILDQCDYHVDYLVLTAGTGGTIAGTAKKFKEKLPSCQIIGVDPYGSILAEPSRLNEYRLGQSYKIEGIGYDFIPSNLNRSYIDSWIKTDDMESFRSARDLIRLEGLLVGGSSGSALAAVLKFAKTLKKHQRCVVILPDNSRNYMSKMMSDDWMIDQGFYPSKALSLSKEEYKKTLASILIPQLTLQRINYKATWDEAFYLGKSAKQKYLIATDSNNQDCGILPLKKYLKCISTGMRKDECIYSYIDKKYTTLSITCTIAEAAEKLLYNHYCVIVDTQFHIQGIITGNDLLNYI